MTEDYRRPDTSRVTNDERTWLVDWTQPIEWHDGTPAEVYGTPWSGQIHVLLDPTRLPQGFKASALRRIAYPNDDDSVAARMRGTKAAFPSYMICTNVLAAYGTPADGSCNCHIVNVSERLAYEAMEAMAIF
jgi:hypothetical protein